MCFNKIVSEITKNGEILHHMFDLNLVSSNKEENFSKT